MQANGGTSYTINASITQFLNFFDDDDLYEHMECYEGRSINFQTFAGEWNGRDFEQPFGDDETYSQSITLPSFGSTSQRDAIDALTPPGDGGEVPGEGDGDGDGGKKSFAAASQVGLVSLFLAVTAVLSA